MQRRSMMMLVGATALAACAPRVQTNPLSRDMRAALAFSRVDVVTTGTAFESTLAGDYATRLGPDLTGILRREFSDRLDPAGAVLNVEVSRLNVAGSVRTAFGRDQSRMLGTARVIDRDGTLLASFPIQVVAGTAAESRTGALARATVTTADRFYRGLLGDFARATREQILGADLPGQRLLRRATTG